MSVQCTQSNRRYRPLWVGPEIVSIIALSGPTGWFLRKRHPSVRRARVQCQSYAETTSRRGTPTRPRWSAWPRYHPHIVLRLVHGQVSPPHHFFARLVDALEEKL